MFRGVVRGTAWQPDESPERGVVDDRAAALRAHLPELVLHARPDAAEIHGVDLVEHVGGLVGCVTGWRLYAGVVEGQVQAAERFDGAVDHRTNLDLV